MGRASSRKAWRREHGLDEDERGTEVDVPDSLRVGVTPDPRGRFPVYPYHCKEKAIEYVIAHPEAEPMLVFGTWRGGTPHGWVEIGESIFDGNMQRFYDRDSYYEAVDAKPRRVWTRSEAMAAVSAFGIPGRGGTPAVITDGSPWCVQAEAL